jgi:hypothetical protein
VAARPQDHLFFLTTFLGRQKATPRTLFPKLESEEGGVLPPFAQGSAGRLRGSCCVLCFPLFFSWFEKKSRTRSRDLGACVNVLGVLGAAAAQRLFEREGLVVWWVEKKKESLTGAMVARLPTEQEVVGSIPTLGCGRAGRTYSDFRLLLNSAVRAVANGR